MTFFRKVANSDILADVIEIPKNLRNMKVEILIFPYENLDDEEILITRNKSVKGILEKYKKEAGGEFDEEILSDLISQGLSGEELLQGFKEIRHQMRPAVEAMLEDAKDIAEGNKGSYSYDDIFCAEDNHV